MTIPIYSADNGQNRIFNKTVACIREHQGAIVSTTVGLAAGVALLVADNSDVSLSGKVAAVGFSFVLSIASDWLVREEDQKIASSLLRIGGPVVFAQIFARSVEK